ncbi:MAG: hypothetical protein HY706_20170 [Candidatus Hydrogenedentes bacterium]|nr:hypothetical protein [Candidatus Hydrogenedentota bacterium]
MKFIGLGMLIVGGGAFLLGLVGATSAIPPLASAGIPTYIWGALGAIGLVIVMLTRTPRD